MTFALFINTLLVLAGLPALVAVLAAVVVLFNGELVPARRHVYWRQPARAVFA